MVIEVREPQVLIVKTPPELDQQPPEEEQQAPEEKQAELSPDEEMVLRYVVALKERVLIVEQALRSGGANFMAIFRQIDEGGHAVKTAINSAVTVPQKRRIEQPPDITVT